MINIQYDRGTFSHVAVMGALAAMQIAPFAPTQEISYHNRNRQYFLCDISSTFNNFDNAINDPYLKFMTRVEPTPFNNIIKPRTELGRKLLEYRRAALAKGMRTLSADEIDAMVNVGRGASA